MDVFEINLNLYDLLDEWRRHDILNNKQVNLNSALPDKILRDMHLQQSKECLKPEEPIES